MSLLLLGVGGVDGQGFNLLNGLVANWAMDETSGTRVDDVSGYQLTESVDPVSSVAGVIDNAAQMLGTASPGELTVLDSDSPCPQPLRFYSSRSFSIEFWLKDLSVSGLAPVVSQGNSFTIFAQAGGSIGVVFEQVQIDDFFSQTTSDWAQIVLTFDKDLDKLKAFANSVFADENFAPTGAPEGTAVLSIDANAEATFRIDNLRIWNRALSTDEIVFLYNNGASRSYSELGG